MNFYECRFLRRKESWPITDESSYSIKSNFSFEIIVLMQFSNYDLAPMCNTYIVVRGKYKQASKKLQCCCMLLIFLMSLCYLSLSMLTSGSILLKAHISEDKFQNTYIQSGPPKVSYLFSIAASFFGSSCKP